MNTKQSSGSLMQIFPKSIQKRLPLSYAGIALLVALSLGAMLVSTLFEYYRQQEISYLNNNARNMQANLTHMLEAGDIDDNLQTQVNLLAFLLETHIELLQPNGDILVASDDITSVIESNAEQPGIRLMVRELQDDGMWVSLTETIIEAEDTLTMKTLENEVIVTDFLFDSDMTTPLSRTVVANEFPIFSNEEDRLHGFGLTQLGDSNFEKARSSQVVTLPLLDTKGEQLATLRLSQGPAYGVEIVTSVIWGWLFASIFSIALAIIVGYFISRNVSQPLLHLTTVTHQMTDGDFSTRANLQRSDEFGSLAKAFNAMATQIESTMITLNHFVSDAAHEINTPITALRTNLEIIIPQQITTLNDKTLQRALEQVIRLQHLTNGLLQLSRLESGEQDSTLQAIHMQSLIHDVTGLYASRAEQKNIELELSFPNQDVIYTANETHIRIAVSNLIDNAIKFTPINGRVSIVLEEANNRIDIHIRDTGVGIPPDHMPYIFNRFHRAPNVADFAGSGLGLAIVHAIIERYRGHITVKNLEQGARFSVSLYPIGH